jgi:hypothetical protein
MSPPTTTRGAMKLSKEIHTLAFLDEWVLPLTLTPYALLLEPWRAYLLFLESVPNINHLLSLDKWKLWALGTLVAYTPFSIFIVADVDFLRYVWPFVLF